MLHVLLWKHLVLAWTAETARLVGSPPTSGKFIVAHSSYASDLMIIIAQWAIQCNSTYFMHPSLWLSEMLIHNRVFGTPANRNSQAIAMTAPVITNGSGGSAIAMTAPVLSTGSVMSFILPSSIRDVSEAPVPLNPQVTLRQIPQRDIAYAVPPRHQVARAHSVCPQGPYFLGQLRRGNSQFTCQAAVRSAPERQHCPRRGCAAAAPVGQIQPPLHPLVHEEE
jgi:hypothetical protein